MQRIVSQLTGGLVLATATILACSSSESTGSGGGVPVLGSLSVSPANFGVLTGGTVAFTAAGHDTTGAPMTTTVSWGATGGLISAAGLFTAGGAPGAAKVWAYNNDISDTARGNVTTVAAVVDTLMNEGFESGSFAIWDDRGSPGNQSIVTTQAHSGTHALQVNFPMGSDGGWLTKFFMPGYDSMYASYYVRFQAGWLGGTKLLALYGSRTDDQWSATGKGGICPSGTDFFIAAVVQERSGNPGPTHFYTSWPGMPQSPPASGSCTPLDGLTSGATYATPLEVLPHGQWHHVEYWVVLNTPGQNNMYQKFCIDGVVRGVWQGISVRSSNILKLNAVTISNSIAFGALQTQLMWADDLVVTRQRPPDAC